MPTKGGNIAPRDRKSGAGILQDIQEDYYSPKTQINKTQICGELKEEYFIESNEIKVKRNFCSKCNSLDPENISLCISFFFLFT